MKIVKPSIKIILFTTRIKADNTYPLKLRLTFKNKRKYFNTEFSATKETWEKINSMDAKGKWRDVKNEIAIIEKNASDCASKLKRFSFIDFERDFYTKPSQYLSIQSAYKAYISKLTSNEQLGTATSYQCALNSLFHFYPLLTLDKITPSFLYGYERWMIAQGKSLTTVGIYLRSLRSIINVAKEDGEMTDQEYPFGKKKYVIPAGKNNKKALDINHIEKIFSHNASSDKIDKAKDFWIFSYLCNGMNMTDILNLKWKNIKTDHIDFERAKTKRSLRAKPKQILIPRNIYIDRILKKWGSKDSKITEYVFPILKFDDTLVNQRKIIQQFIKVTNHGMKSLAAELELNINLTTYVARHSFATIMVKAGAPLKLISQSLGHSSILTTEKYIGSFSLEEQTKYNNNLTRFN